MENNAKISIIVPIYNTADYLERCLNSIINQTHKNLEIICIDDGSTDGSGELLDKIAATDDRIIAIHIPNGGVSNARNTGLERATGEFLGFVDSDDYIELDMYEFLYKKAVETDADMVQCDYRTIYGGEANKEEKTDPKIEIIDSKREIIKAKLIDKISVSVWSKIYKTSTINKTFFLKEVAYGEDAIWVSVMCKNFEIVCITNYNGYNYYQRNTSVTNSTISEKNFSPLPIYEKNFINYKEDPELFNLALIGLMKAYFNRLVLILKHKAFLERYDELRNKILKNIKILYINKNVKLKLKMIFFLLHFFPQFFNWYYTHRK